MSFACGFQLGRHHEAIHAGTRRKRVNWVLDADIQGFFDAMGRTLILRFL